MKQKMAEATQPERLPGDGPVSIRRDGDSHYCISVEAQSFVVSGFNAWRLFGMLAFMLGIRLPAKLMKGIKL